MSEEIQSRASQAVALIDEVVAAMRERWRDGMSEAALERALSRLRVVLATHPVAIEYTSRVLERPAQAYTYDTRDAGDDALMDIAVGVSALRRHAKSEG